MAGVHRVRQLRWQAGAGSAADGFALRTLLRERGDALQAALGRAFDAAGPGEQVLHLPRLEMALAAADLEALDGNFELRLEAVAREALERALAAPLRSAPAVASGVAEARGADRCAAGVAGARDAPDSRGAPDAPMLRDAAAARREALRHYLARGLLNWTHAGLAPEHADGVLRQAATEALGASGVPPTAAWTDLVDPSWSLQRRAGALLRWLALLTPSQRRAWVVGVDAAVLPPAALGAWHELVDEAEIPLDLQAIWLTAQTDTRGASGAPAAAFWAQATRRWLASVAATAASSAARQRLQEALRTLDGAAAAPAAPAARHRRRAPDRSAGAAAPDFALQRAPDPARDPDVQAGASLLVPLAGLVLLHPYLPRLLAACGLYTAGQRTFAPEHLPRACAVLRALADARDEVHEHELPFVKLLLGAAPDEPLPNALPVSTQAPMPARMPAPIATPIPIPTPILAPTPTPTPMPTPMPKPMPMPMPKPALMTTLIPTLMTASLPALMPAEREEVAAVLEAARSHWSALRGTSVEGLRSSFLQRRGLLERADGAWRLRLQTEPWDMLVALLPWSIGFVKLPWMARPLVVEWPTP